MYAAVLVSDVKSIGSVWQAVSGQSSAALCTVAGRKEVACVSTSIFLALLVLICTICVSSELLSPSSLVVGW